jgi:hypothetical protein
MLKQFFVRGLGQLPQREADLKVDPLKCALGELTANARFAP